MVGVGAISSGTGVIVDGMGLLEEISVGSSVATTEADGEHATRHNEMVRVAIPIFLNLTGTAENSFYIT
jgi:hypothetical protein